MVTWLRRLLVRAPRLASKTKHDSSPASWAGSRSSKTPARDALGDQQVALVVDRAQELALRR